LTNKSDLNISVSASNQQSGKKFISSFKSVVVNNGIDQQKFDPNRQYRDIRQELNIPKNKILVLFVARFTSHKQPISLIKAFQKAVESNPEMHLLMVGEGDERLAAEKIIVESRLENKITLQPFRQDVPDLLAAADIFVLPSLWEGLPIGLLEAMAMGKAVIASEVDGTVEIVQHNKNGFLIKTIDLVNELARSLLLLSQDAPLRDSFGREAIKTVKDRFNASVMTREIEKIYTTLYTKQIEKNKN
ncbi:MAG: glycosyltransferase family 4 protein, partial [Chitinophagaceae bacterium]